MSMGCMVLPEFGISNLNSLCNRRNICQGVMESPWIEDMVGLPVGVGSDYIIRKESMAMYYGGL